MRYRTTPLSQHRVSSDRICLTFDDGPCPGVTQKVMDILDSRGHRATFFVVGTNCRHLPGGLETIKEIHQRGHEVGNHTWTHCHARELKSADDFEKQIVFPERKIREYLGIAERIHFRSPWGSMSFKLWRFLHRRGQKAVKWTVGPGAPEEKLSAPELIQRYRNSKIRGGDIVLMHDDSPHVLEILPSILDFVEANSLKSSTLTGNTDES